MWSCGDSNACAVVCLECKYVERVRGCEGDVNAGVVDGVGVVAVCAEHEYVCGIRGSSIVSSAADVLWMGVVRVMRVVGGVCKISICLDRGCEGVSGYENWVWALPILWKQGGVGRVSLLGCDDVGSVGG